MVAIASVALYTAPIARRELENGRKTVCSVKRVQPHREASCPQTEIATDELVVSATVLPSADENARVRIITKVLLEAKYSDLCSAGRRLINAARFEPRIVIVDRMCIVRVQSGNAQSTRLARQPRTHTRI